MEPLAAGEAEPVRPLGTAQDPPRSGRADAPPDRAGTPSREGTSGSVAIRVQPSDAEILIDGERWTGNGDDRLVVQLSPGRHQIEARKDGYRPFSTAVDIRAGESTPLNVSLGRLP